MFTYPPMTAESIAAARRAQLAERAEVERLTGHKVIDPWDALLPTEHVLSLVQRQQHPSARVGQAGSRASLTRPIEAGVLIGDAIARVVYGGNFVGFKQR